MFCLSDVTHVLWEFARRRKAVFVLTALAVGIGAGVSPAAAQTLSSGTNQFFNVGSPDRVANPITITDAGGTINTATGIRIIIPVGLNLQWSDTVTTLAVGGSASGKINTTPTYSASGDTLIIEVTSDWSSGDQLVISNLVFTNFSNINTAQRLRMVAGADPNETDNRTIRILAALVHIESDTDQSFAVGDPATPIETIEITEAGSNLQIKAGKDIRVRIPAGVSMIWDTTITAPIIGGPDANRVSPTVHYENVGKVLVINVTTNFSADDWITISGLKFTEFTAASSGFLELVLDPIANTADATDDQSKTIVGQIYGTLVSPHVSSASRLPSNGTHYTIGFTVSNTGNGTTSYVLLTSRRTGRVSTVSMTGTDITQGSNPDSALITNVLAGGNRIATVTYSVDNAPDGSIDTLVFRARAIGNLAVTDSGLLIVTLTKPVVTVVKSVNPSGTQIPGTDLTYTVTISNAGSENAKTVVHVDTLPTSLGLKLGSVSVSLPPGMTGPVTYSDDGGATWDYAPQSGACGAPAGYDYCVRDIRTSLGDGSGLMGPQRIVTIVYVAKLH